MKHVIYTFLTATLLFAQPSTCTTRWDPWLKRYVTACDKPRQTCITTYDRWLKEWKTVCK